MYFEILNEHTIIHICNIKHETVMVCYYYYCCNLTIIAKLRKFIYWKMEDWKKQLQVH